jgi:hypothetical protein
MNRKTLISISALALCCLGGVPSALAQNAPENQREPEKAPVQEEPTSASELVVDYNGRLQDGRGRPISGVFNLAFKLYDGRHAAEAAWQERHFVAVVDGDYIVALGSKAPLTQSTLPDDAWIGVELVGEGELLRDRFRMGEASAGSAGSGATSGAGNSELQWAMSDKTRALLEAAKTGERITFADVAERAVTADKANFAKSAATLGEMSAEELEKATQIALDRLGAHIADPDAHAATGGLLLGNDHAVQRRVGGSGGDPYQVNCPPGYVVTGIKGGAGRMLDSISIICTQLR